MSTGALPPLYVANGRRIGNDFLLVAPDEVTEDLIGGDGTVPHARVWALQARFPVMTPPPSCSTRRESPVPSPAGHIHARRRVSSAEGRRVPALRIFCRRCFGRGRESRQRGPSGSGSRRLVAAARPVKPAAGPPPTAR